VNASRGQGARSALITHKSLITHHLEAPLLPEEGWFRFGDGGGGRATPSIISLNSELQEKLFDKKSLDFAKKCGKMPTFKQYFRDFRWLRKIPLYSWTLALNFFGLKLSKSRLDSSDFPGFQSS